MKNKTALAQFYTPMSVGVRMCELLKNTGRLLEPSAGSGNLLDALRASGKTYDSVYAVELDREQAEKIVSTPNLRTYVGDFFSVDQPSFNSILANPPFIRYRDVIDDTKELPAFKALEPMLGSANLYLYTICHAVKQLAPKGELVCICPIDFMNSSSGIEARKWLDNIGVITKVVSLADKKVFPDADPDCIVFRFSLDCTEKPVLKLVGGNFVHTSVVGERLGSMASVHVGAVPASKGLWESVGKAEELIEFEGSSGSEYYHPNALYIRPPNGKVFQLVANCKSRHAKPFRVLETAKPITGALLGIIPNAGVDIHELCDRLNAANWKGLFLLQGRRFNFGQRTLTEALI